ncbi:L-type lectin-domain containing receptor kinase VIII.1-like [Populus alba x Populus x berolinensis]|nr:L-type lectin-domain containing receptor kinase VIII.1-like [Populus alba x Populus x berolinensis]
MKQTLPIFSLISKERFPVCSSALARCNPEIVHDVKLLGKRQPVCSNRSLVLQLPFETTFSFQFSNSSAESHVNSTGGYNNSGGSALAFIVVPDESTVGRPGPWLAMLNDAASTGEMTQIHNVYSWNFTSTSQASLRAPTAETCESKIMEQYDQGVQSSASHSSKKEPPTSLLIFICVMALAISVFASLFYNGRRRNNQTEAVILPDKRQRPRPPNKPRRFTISEVSSATRGFHEYEILGSDSKGIYYRGKLPNGCQVAIKRFSAQFLSSQIGLDRRRLLKQISTISRVRHPNLVPIRGWCQDNRETMVVYDFYPNGSLDKWLFGAGVLPWTRRLKVVKDVADALSFLHSKQLAHKNMKTTSVFLDVSFRAVLGDFGFVLSSTESQRFEATVSQKADVFEFGIFVLEVVSGRGRLESELRQDERDLLDFAWRMHEIDEKARLVDRRMGSMVNLEQAIRVSEIGLLCTLNENKGRPCMEEAVEFLNWMDRFRSCHQIGLLLFFPTAAPILVSALAIPALFSSESTEFLVCKINTIKFCRQANQSRDVWLFNDSIPTYTLSSYILMAITVIMKLNPTF